MATAGPQGKIYEINPSQVVTPTPTTAPTASPTIVPTATPTFAIVTSKETPTPPIKE